MRLGQSCIDKVVLEQQVQLTAAALLVSRSSLSLSAAAAAELYRYVA
jgi:hypothetical protein